MQQTLKQKFLEPLFTKVVVPLIILKKRGESFSFKGKKLPYFGHTYNVAWSNERTIEVPIAMSYIRRDSSKRILEVGNVLSHYYKRRWDVVDKYEKADGVLNEDIVLFKPKEKYDLIITISTLEHVGYDEKEKDPNKILRALKNIKNNCLSINGLLIATLPLGYNKEMDNLIFREKLGFNEEIYLKKISKDNRWVEITKEEAKSKEFSYLLPYESKVLLVGLLKN